MMRIEPKKTWFFVTTAGTIITITTLIISNITGLVYRNFYRNPPMILMLKTMVSGVQIFPVSVTNRLEIQWDRTFDIP